MQVLAIVKLWSGERVRELKKLLVVLSAALATAALAASPAFAGTDTWDGSDPDEQGAKNLPCPNGGFWVLSPGANVGTAILTVNGVVVGQMQQAGNGAYQLASSGPVTTSSTASVTWSGSSTAAFLKLSHCAGSSTTTTTTEGPTTTTEGPTTTTEGPTTTTEGPTTTTEGPTTTTEGPTTTTEGPTTTAGGPTSGSGGVSGGTTGGTTGGTAPTGGELPFTGLPIWVPLLAAAGLLASGIMLIRRRKGELS